MRASHDITDATGSWAVLRIQVEPAGVFEGWSSVRIWDLVGFPEDEPVFSPEEGAFLDALFERFALYADAQLAPDLFPRPAHRTEMVDPVPDLLVPRLVAELVDTLTTMLRTRSPRGT